MLRNWQVAGKCELGYAVVQTPRVVWCYAIGELFGDAHVVMYLVLYIWSVNKRCKWGYAVVESLRVLWCYK